MSIPFTFPAPLDVFAGYQETLIGRPLSVDEKELTAAWLDIINQAKPKEDRKSTRLNSSHRW